MLKREERFAHEYIISGGNAYQAALAAGYKKSTASHASDWLNETTPNHGKKRNLPYKPELKKYIDEQTEKMKSEKIADASEVMEYLTSVMRGESESEIVVVEGIGDGRSEARRINKRPEEKDRLKAADSLGKILGISKERLDVTASQVVLVDEVPEDW